MSTERYTWLITGADQGIGMELVKLLLASHSNIVLVPVYGTASLEGLVRSAKGRLHLIPLHRDEEEVDPLLGTIHTVSSIVGEGGIDYLLNHTVVTEAGWDAPSNMDLNALECDYRINVVGPARAYQAYLPLIAKSTKQTVINVFSSQGIVGRHGRASCTTTSITKAALKVLTQKESAESRHSTVVLMTLGHLNTDPLSKTEVIVEMLDTILDLTPEDTGKEFLLGSDAQSL
ncbi:hypothetical protein ONZ51_g8404 [Trametes cubensis]|uniref:NAD(P)-binding protein n=1 Tax=Trametes cubensis TaxID=1111947 RepID=A0AAD7X6K5_9APHY|nr:hypothetical protein ONZ51_g8404 [Trametes cubensis]